MIMTTSLRRHLLLASPALLLAACASETPEPVASAPVTPAAPAASPAEVPANARPDARVELSNWQVGYIGQVGWGSGVLTYRGRRLPFRVRSAGVGGLGVARVTATGDVFDMRDVSLFPGTYVQARGGMVVPGAQMTGFVWLQNANGVRIRLRPRRTGIALQLGADGVLIEMR
ncbi:MAG: hypothetical protein EBY30_19095 [Rhodospirillales bacterium]|nr:hypothetical protein [Rhodospirillales bacterium]